MERARLRAEIIRRLLGDAVDVPTARLGRLRRLAGAALKAGRLVRGSADVDHEPDLDALVALVAQVGELKGVAMKAGQILSYVDLDLPDAVKAALSVLQTHAQPMAFARVREIVTAELGDRGRALLVAMHPTPIAAASIGQVHRARLADGTRVAVKVQYPEVERALAADFGVGRAMAGLVSRAAGNPTPAAFAREIAGIMLDECDYRREARLQERFAAALRGHPTLTIAAVHHDFCSRRVLTTTFVEGAGLDAWLATNPEPAARNRVGAALFEFYIGSLFRTGLFNADPHPGNYLFLSDGRVAVLDHGCVREFDATFVAALARLSHALADGESADFRAAAGALGMHPTTGAELETLRALFVAFYGPMLVDRVQPMVPHVIASLRELVESKRKLLRLQLPGEFPFLLRIRFGLMSVLARIGAEANWYRLEQSLLPQPSPRT